MYEKYHVKQWALVLSFSAVLKMFDCLLVPTVSVTQLLERISEVAEQNRLFTSESPGLGQELETLQQHLESLSSTPLPPDCNFNNSQGLMYSHALLTFSGL